MARLTRALTKEGKKTSDTIITDLNNVKTQLNKFWFVLLEKDRKITDKNRADAVRDIITNYLGEKYPEAVKELTNETLNLKVKQKSK